MPDSRKTKFQVFHHKFLVQPIIALARCETAKKVRSKAAEITQPSRPTPPPALPFIM